MTKEEMQERYIKAIEGGKELLERADFLSERGLKMASESGPYTLDRMQGITLHSVALEMRYFYEKMFE